MRVLGQEVVLGRPGVLEAAAVGGLDDGDLVHQPVVLGGGIARREVVRYVQAVEETEFHGAYGTRTILPAARRPSRSATACPASSSGLTCGATGCSAPASILASTSSTSARFSFGWRSAQPPHSMPTTSRLLRSTRLSGT